MLKRAFTEHPASVGENYFQHMGMAFRFSAKMFGAGLCCLIHGVFPFLFKRTGSDCVAELYDRMRVHRDRRETAADAAPMPSMARDKTGLRAAE